MLKHKRRSQGFSLIELLIVVTIILIIAAIAIPKLLTVKQLANATAAVSNLHTLNTALTAYASEYPTIGYPTNLLDLDSTAGSTTAPTSTAAALLSEEWNSNTVTVQQYNYAYTPTAGPPSTIYNITAEPVTGAGTRYFYTDQSGEIRYADGTAASATSPLIG